MECETSTYPSIEDIVDAVSSLLSSFQALQDCLFQDCFLPETTCGVVAVLTISS